MEMEMEMAMEMETLRDENKKLQNENKKLREYLRWYVENDDIWEGGKWEEYHAPLLAKKREAMKLLNMPTEEDWVIGKPPSRRRRS